MDETIISSNLIESISYHGKTMFIKFNDGKLFSYNNVPREIFNEFISTVSPDEFYAKKIVPKYSFQRMV